MMGFCEHGNEPWGSIKKIGFFDKPNDNQLFQIIFTTRSE
jgi:hypothetical protein